MNRVVHFEIHAKDPDKMEKFYTDIFGWKVQKTGKEFDEYRILISGEMKDLGINGGMTKREGVTLPKAGDPVNAFVCIIGVSDVDEYVEKVLKAGGTLALAKMVVPTVGDLAYCKDPEGNLFGMIKPVPSRM